MFGKHIESFYFFPTNISECSECSYKNYQTCRECVNCGYCTKNDGTTLCVEGNYDGPFNDTCISWEYGDNINPNKNLPTRYYFSGYPKYNQPFNQKHQRHMYYSGL